MSRKSWKFSPIKQYIIPMAPVVWVTLNSEIQKKLEALCLLSHVIIRNCHQVMQCLANLLRQRKKVGRMGRGGREARVFRCMVDMQAVKGFNYAQLIGNLSTELLLGDCAELNLDLVAVEEAIDANRNACHQ